MQLYFIRHGQSENNAQLALTGLHDGRIADPALTDVGRRQAICLANFLSSSPYQGDNDVTDIQNTGGFGFTHLYTSLMIRAVETGQEIAKALSLPLIARMDIHETGGIYLRNPETGVPEGLPGKGRSYFETNFPNLVLPDEVTDTGWWNRPFEVREQRPLRAQAALDDLLSAHQNAADSVALISHGGFFNYFLAAVLGVKGERQAWFSMNNTAITRIDFVAESTRIDIVAESFIAYTNRVDYLPQSLIT